MNLVFQQLPRRTGAGFVMAAVCLVAAFAGVGYVDSWAFEMAGVSFLVGFTCMRPSTTWLPKSRPAAPRSIYGRPQPTIYGPPHRPQGSG